MRRLNEPRALTRMRLHRRAFLQGGLALGIAPGLALAKQDAKLLPPVELPKLDEGVQKTSMPTALPMSERLGIAIVGLGRLALEQVLPAIAESQRVRVTALVTGDAAKGRRVAAQYGVRDKAIYDYDHMHELAHAADVEAVYVITPNALHLPHVVRAAQAGKHVLCEKPMATSVEDAQQMIAACAQAKRTLMIAYRIQFEPHNRKVMRWVRDKAFGETRLLQLECCQAQSRTNVSQWRMKKQLSGGGALPDVGIYCQNTARFLLGEEPNEVGGTLVQPRNDPRFAEVEESVAWWMRFPSGALAQCTTSYGTFDSKRYRVLGGTGWAEMDPAFPYEGLKLRRAHVDAGAVVKEDVELPSKNQFALEMDHFAECIATGVRPYTPGEEGLQDLRIMKAIYAACASGQSVKLDGGHGLDQFRGTMPS